MLRAVVTAGGRVDEAFAAAIGTPVKALAPFGGGVLLETVLAAIAGAGTADIAVVGGREIEQHLGAARLIPAAPDGATNIARALDAWPAGDDLRELLGYVAEHRPADAGPFDLVVTNHERPGAERMAELAGAGTTWWLQGFGERPRLADVRAAAAAGPPQWSR